MEFTIELLLMKWREQAADWLPGLGAGGGRAARACWLLGDGAARPGAALPAACTAVVVCTVHMHTTPVQP